MMKVALLIIWLILGMSYFLIWHSSKKECCDKALDALSFEDVHERPWMGKVKSIEFNCIDNEVELKGSFPCHLIN